MDTVEKKLKGLVKLQDIDSKFDELLKVRGDLPEEVQDLEDDIAGLETRIEKFETELKGIETDIDNKKNSIKESEALIIKYNEQQKNVRNNREFDAITKEVELQELEIKVSEKKIKEAFVQIEFKTTTIEDTKGNLDGRLADLKIKKEELKAISAESEEEEAKLNEDREKASKKVEERLLLSYNKLRNRVKNGLAVVKVERNACGGCFATVPPQVQADIKEKRKILVCEHCGRVLYDVVDVVVEEKPKKKRTVRKAKAKA